MHNWSMAFTKMIFRKEVPESLRPYTDWGIGAKRFWACKRGNKIKHVKPFIEITRGFENERLLLTGEVFFAGSGFIQDQREYA